MFTNQAPAQKRRVASGCKRTWEEIIEQMDGGNTTTRYLTVNNFNMFANKSSFLIVAPFFIRLDIVAKIACNEFKAKCIKHINHARSQMNKEADAMVDKIIRRASMQDMLTLPNHLITPTKGSPQIIQDIYS
jgi:hypothetical protein